MQGIYIKDLGFNFVKTCFSLYNENIYFFGIYIAAILFLLYTKKKELQMLSIYTLFLFLTIFNPILVYYFYAPFEQDNVYYRFFWLLPVNFLLAYGCVFLLEKGHFLIQRFFLCICLITTICFMGSPVKSWSEITELPENLYKIPNEVREISDILHEPGSNEKVYAAVAPELLLNLRQYDASVFFTIERDMYLCWAGMPDFQSRTSSESYLIQKELMEVIYSGNLNNPQGFSYAIQETGTNTLIFSNTLNIQDFLSSQHFIEIEKTENYSIYKYTE